MVVEWSDFRLATYSDASSMSDALTVASLTATGGNPCGPDVWPLVQPEASRSAAAAAARVARMECLTLLGQTGFELNRSTSAQYYTQKKSEGQLSRSREGVTFALKKVALGRVLASSDRSVVRRCRLEVAIQSSEQVGADRMEQVVLTEVEPVDKGEGRVCSLDLGDRDRTVEGDHGTRR